MPHPASDEFAYLVAVHAWGNGLTANSIVRELGLKQTPLHLMQVKRALRRAQNRFLRLEPLPNEALEKDLAACINSERRRIRFYVVEDQWKGSSAAIYVKAAMVLAQIIADAVRSNAEAKDSEAVSDTESQVVVCNGGGRSVSETVKALQRNPPVLDESDEKETQLRDRLLFVAGNSAYHPDQFQRSANFLSVTMAEVYSAKHLALPNQVEEEFLQMHKSLVERAAIFVCGCGARDKGLLARDFLIKGFEVPKNAVGDLAFNWLDNEGRPVALDSQPAREHLTRLNPTLDINTLMHLAANSRVLLVLNADEPLEKQAIGIAALRREYVTDVVLGARLASSILKAWKPRK